MRPNDSAIERMLSPTDRSSDTEPRAVGPTAIFRMYISGSDGIAPRGDAAIIEIAFVPPRATTARPSSGSSARSTCSPPAPIIVPVPSCSAPSGAPITMRPSTGSCSSASRAPENAASSAASLSARPSQRAPASAACSVTRAKLSHWHGARAPSAAAGPRAARRSGSRRTSDRIAQTDGERDHGLDRLLHVRVLDNLDTLALGAPDQEALDAANVVDAAQGTCPSPACRRSPCRGRGNACGGHPRRRSRRSTWTISAPSSDAGTSPGTRCTPSSTIDQPSVSERRIAASTPTQTCRDCSTKPAISGSASALDRRAGLEARVVDRRHVLVREERAHRLADEVGRGDPRDARAGARPRTRRSTCPVPVVPPISTIRPFEYGTWSSRCRSSPNRLCVMPRPPRAAGRGSRCPAARRSRSSRARRAARAPARARRRRRSPPPSARPGTCRRPARRAPRAAAPRFASCGETCTSPPSRCETSVPPAVNTATRPSSGSVAASRNSTRIAPSTSQPTDTTRSEIRRR